MIFLDEEFSFKLTAINNSCASSNFPILFQDEIKHGAFLRYDSSPPRSLVCLLDSRTMTRDISNNYDINTEMDFRSSNISQMIKRIFK